MHFDRRIPQHLMDALSPNGPLHWLIQRTLKDRKTLDFQLRGFGKGAGHVTLYKGLTSVINVHATGKEQVRFSTHPTYQQVQGFDRHWLRSRPIPAIYEWMGPMQAFVESVIESVKPRYISKEGQVQTLLAAEFSDAFTVLDKESVIAFGSIFEKKAVVDPLKSTYLKPVRLWLGAHERKDPTYGLELDLLGVDRQGRVLVIEVKPGNASEGIAWSPAQVGFYLAIFRRWASAVGPDGPEILREMLKQRVTLGLAKPFEIREPLEFVPVIAIGAPIKSKDDRALRRMAGVRYALQQSGLHERDLQLWMVSEKGDVAVETPPVPKEMEAPKKVSVLKSRRWLSGAEVFSSTNSREVASVGRFGGLNGKPFKEDLSTGRWREWNYRVSDKPSSSPGWFSLEDFVAAVRGGPTPPDDVGD